MRSIRLSALSACLLPAAFSADVTTHGTVSVGGGYSSIDGDKPAFSQALQRPRGAVGGIEEFSLTKEGKDYRLRFDGRALFGEEDYLAVLKYDYNEKLHLEAGYQSFREWYDGSGGFFRPKNLGIKLFDENLHLDRAKVWVAAGLSFENGTYIKLRYDQRTRDGTKSSTHWADTNLVGAPYGTRNIVPSFYDLDEVTRVITADVGNESAEEQKWNAGIRYSETKLDNMRNTRRRSGESADRIVTTKDETKTDIFSAHGYYLRKINEQLTVSGGALITNLDSNLSGSRIYGQTYDPVYDPKYVRRQQRDEGFTHLEGHSDLKQTVLNLNAVYEPVKNWTVRPSMRYENLHQETNAEFMETNIGAGPSFSAILEEIEAEQKKHYDEFTEALEVRYTGKPKWTFSGEAMLVQGSGDLEEDRLMLETGVKTIDRDSEMKRYTQKYSFTTNYYAKPGLTFAAQYYFKAKQNDYNAVRDNTLAGSADRYPAFITDQDFETHDVNFRVSWHPLASLSSVTRYDLQKSKVISQEAGLQKVQGSDFTSHIVSQSLTWTPMTRLYFVGNVNVTFDQLKTPAYAFVKQGDNNYINGSLGGGYAVAQKDDVYVDYSWFNASNFIDNSATSLPYNLSQRQHLASVTWVRRHSEHLTLSLRYSYITNRDGTWAGRNDFNAHLVYGKVQYHF
ncbi:hypothetical protein [Nibricoccus sp. IMCC34717]|uniref:hypothetical protein n=1 Tax=Nibricoccus sp. IMCC34717 TaxID=3034021 RepID=UPI00384C1939